MTPNIQQQEAIDTCIRMPRGEVAYIDGPAGTGKSFVVDRITEVMPNILKCAYTGNAAQNIGGCTINKLFSLDTQTIFNPEWTYTTYRQFMYGKYGKSAGRFFNKHKMEILSIAQAIVIDEAPMAPCHMVDAIDRILRGVLKKPHDAFGGMRMIFCGDRGQLQSIVTPTDEIELKKYGYKSPYGFLEAKVFEL